MRLWILGALAHFGKNQMIARQIANHMIPNAALGLKSFPGSHCNLIRCDILIVAISKQFGEAARAAFYACPGDRGQIADCFDGRYRPWQAFIAKIGLLVAGSPKKIHIPKCNGPRPGVAGRQNHVANGTRKLRPDIQ